MIKSEKEKQNPSWLICLKSRLAASLINTFLLQDLTKASQ